MNNINPLDIDVYSDYVCPWCYLSSAAISKIEQNFNVNIRWIPFPLHPETPEEGLSLQQLFGGKNMDQAHAYLRQRMSEVGLEYTDREYTYNTRKAQELAMWADTQANGKAIHQALFRQYFVYNRNLATEEVLLNAVQEAGLSTSAAKQALHDRPFKNAVDECWSKARQLQITGVPSFVANGFLVSGAQPYAELEKFVHYVLSQKKSQ